jgi:hypothetical protein
MNSDHRVTPQISESALRNIRTYCCPGETLSISEAVHLGRLASGWQGCNECIWRHEAGNISQNSGHRPTVTDTDRRHLQSQIRRTEFGVRGPYLNAIDRFRGAQLASIFSMHLVSVHNEAGRLTNLRKPSHESRIEAAAAITIAVGYDGRRGSADVFSGVVSAVLQNGCNVVDAGRSTAASVLNVSRRFPHLCGSLLVTGAGGTAGEVGLDAFDPHGQGVAVPWQKFGVSVRMKQAFDPHLPQSSADSTDFGSAHAADARLRDLRSVRPPQALAANAAQEQVETTTLQLPELHNSGGVVFRTNRRSGSLTAITAEQFYLDWLLRWWPVHSRQAARFLVNDDQSAKRLEWLTQHCSLNVDIQRPRNVLLNNGEQRAKSDDIVSFEVHEDDRFLTVRSRRGRELPVDELAAWMNRCMPTSSMHLTAHASPCGRRVLLVDVAAPDTGHQQQVISDGLAVSGWILTSMANGQNPLPV